MPKERDELPTIASIRTIRTMEAVEWMGTDDAIALLDAWSKGHREALLTVEATAALQRLKRK